LKTHITAVEKEVLRLADMVTRERDHSTLALISLARSIASSSGSLVTRSISPSPTTLTFPPTQDPFLLRSAAESQMLVQMQKENEMIRAVLSWTEKTEQLEKEVFTKVAACWKIWESSK
jgi:hypothetical protein